MRDADESRRFADRQEAGQALADRLTAGRLPPDAVVLAVPRGGVPVAAVVARRLGLALDVMVAHKIGAPHNPELAIGAVTSDGTVVIESWAREFGLSRADLQEAAAAEIGRAQERQARLRGGRSPVSLEGRTVVVVDDGIATGATVEAAALAARAAGAARVVIAVPVGPPESLERLRTVADEVVALRRPVVFWAVGEWYAWFPQVSDEEVTALLEAGTAGVSGASAERRPRGRP